MQRCYEILDKINIICYNINVIKKLITSLNITYDI